MSFPKSFLEELKSRIRVSDVIGRRVKLQRRGREFVGLSPFNNEKTPSFTVNDDKQFYHCFSSGEHGDVIKFLEKTENLTFLEAVQRLAEEAGMELPQRDPRAAEQDRRRAGLVDVVEMAASFFRAELAGDRGRVARDYLDGRGVPPAIRDRFGLGFAPAGRTALKSHLASKGVEVAQMVEAGLLIAGSDIPEPYDRFRGRVIFPIEDARGRVIAFGGRALSPDAQAKYLNSPETPLFHKGRVLYNLARARKPASDTGTVVVVEGYMDVIALASAGIENAVAPLGTALTEQHLRLLWRLAPEPVLCFDGDRAGLKAAFRSIDRALPLLNPGHSVRFALLPQGHDPDDLVRVGGVEAMQKVIDAARPLADMLWDRELEAAPWDTPERRAALEARLDQAVGSIANEKVRGHYRQAFVQRLAALFDDAGEAVSRGPAGTGRPGRMSQRRGRRRAFVSSETRSTAASGQGGESLKSLEELMVLTLVNHPWLLERHADAVERLQLTDPSLDNLLNEIIHVAAEAEGLDTDGIRAHFADRGQSEAIGQLEASAHTSLAAIRRDASAEDVDVQWNAFLSRYRLKFLNADLEAAQKAFNEDMTQENFDRLRALQQEIERAEAAEMGMATQLKEHGYS